MKSELILVKSDGKHADFIALVEELDKYLKLVDGEDHNFYNQFNGITDLKYCMLAYYNDIPVACGSIKEYDEITMEVKRMYVSPNFRNKKIASKVLTALEDWAEILEKKRIVLETGKRQIEAVNFYKKNNYKVIDNFEPYIEVTNSICFEKILNI